jgi:penicillin amidase
MRRLLKWTGIVVLGLLALAVLAASGGLIWLRTSLPLVDGAVAVPGLAHPVSLERDDRGVVTIRADRAEDAYFAIGYAHAQDRLFQMDLMRRVGAGRLAEVVGKPAVATDRLMRTLGLYAAAEDQVKAASPALRGALDAYTAGVNAFLTSRSGALPPEFLLLGYRPEPWRPADSLVWGRLMALQLSSNWRDERLNAQLKKSLAPDLFKLLRPEAGSLAGLPLPWFGRLNVASNNWVVAPAKSETGGALLANDPHLGLTAPSIWYLVRIVTPARTWIGATSPGMPLIVIGSNGNVAWGLTTTSGDTEDLFEEKPVPGDPTRYQTFYGSAAFDIRKETIRVKGGADQEITIRATAHGPVVSDLDDDRKPGDPIYALAAAFLAPNDRTPNALMAMNLADDADAFHDALANFHAPQQNIVYADRAGHIGFVAAGRVPVRRKVYAEGLLPAPGWTDDYDWTGFIPLDGLPQTRDPGAGWLATANNKIVPDNYPFFMAGRWPDDGRYRRIADLLQQKPAFGIADFEAMQQDTLSAPLRDLVRSWLPRVKNANPDAIQLLQAWDGHADRNRPETLIATLWMSRTARALLGQKLGAHYDDWWFWDYPALQSLLADPKWCAPGGCDALLQRTLADTVAALQARLGGGPNDWKWGDLHRLHFTHPVLRNVPLLGAWFDPDLPTDGDMFTLNRAVPVERAEPLDFPDVHGPTLRIVVDMKHPADAAVTLAGGQSGNPLSPHYADWLVDWRDGRYRSIVQPPVNSLRLEPVNWSGN